MEFTYISKSMPLLDTLRLIMVKDWCAAISRYYVKAEVTSTAAHIRIHVASYLPSHETSHLLDGSQRYELDLVFAWTGMCLSMVIKHVHIYVIFFLFSIIHWCSLSILFSLYMYVKIHYMHYLGVFKLSAFKHFSVLKQEFI